MLTEYFLSIMELNWISAPQRQEDKLDELLSSVHVVHTAAKEIFHVVYRTRFSGNEMYKNEKCP